MTEGCDVQGPRTGWRKGTPGVGAEKKVPGAELVGASGDGERAWERGRARRRQKTGTFRIPIGYQPDPKSIWML